MPEVDEITVHTLGARTLLKKEHGNMRGPYLKHHTGRARHRNESIQNWPRRERPEMWKQVGGGINGMLSVVWEHPQTMVG